jgi:hypothetical protein
VFLGLIGSHIDVHERRQAQEEGAEHADKLKDFALRLAINAKIWNKPMRDWRRSLQPTA